MSAVRRPRSHNRKRKTTCANSDEKQEHEHKRQQAVRRNKKARQQIASANTETFRQSLAHQHHLPIPDRNDPVLFSAEKKVSMTASRPLHAAIDKQTNNDSPITVEEEENTSVLRTSHCTSSYCWFPGC
jgi:hypothetical protein